MKIVLDAGHGATTALSGGKLWNHPNQVFHKDGIFYEGTFNRQIANELRTMLIANGHEIFFSHLCIVDTNFTERMKVVRSVKPDMFISLHGNAFDGVRNVRGFEIFAPTGYPKSIAFGNTIFESVKREFGQEINYRPHSSSQACKEMSKATVWAARNLVPISVLVEFLFFDNLKDALLLNDFLTRQRFCKAITEAVNKYRKV